jgi:hypothetical protein
MAVIPVAGPSGGYIGLKNVETGLNVSQFPLAPDGGIVLSAVTDAGYPFSGVLTGTTQIVPIPGAQFTITQESAEAKGFPDDAGDVLYGRPAAWKASGVPEGTSTTWAFAAQNAISTATHNS